MGTSSTSASDLGGPISVGGGRRIIEVPPPRNLADLAPLRLSQPEAVVVTRPRPELGLGGQLVDLATKQALQRLLGAEPTGEAIKVLRDEIIELYNDAPRGVQYAVIGAVSLGAVAYAVGNADQLLQQLGNSTFSVDLPVGALGIEGVKLTVQVSLDDFNPRLSSVMLQLSNVFGGTLVVDHSIDFNVTNLAWQLIHGAEFVQLRVNGLGTPNPSVGASFRITF